MDYQEQQKNNEEAFLKAISLVRPDIANLMQVIDMTGIDPEILIQVTYALERIVGLGGTRYGNVVVQIENGTVTFVRGDASRKLNIPALKLPVDSP